jgi:D-alanine-D-alanine ligase
VSRRIRVAVLAGGRSSEHEISLASARSVLEALDPERYEAVTVAIGRDGRWRLDQTLGRGQVFELPEGSRELSSVETRNLKDLTPHRSAESLPIPTDSVPTTLANVDVVLPILHGPFGEDGTVQGLLELADVPYVGAGVAASALCMDKDLFKKVMRDSGVPVAEHVALRLGDEIQNPFGYPVFVKPARLGSSVGITKVHDESELCPAVELARQHDEKVLVEEFVVGMEVECGVLGNRVPPPLASLPGRIDTLDHEWYDFASKYDEDGMELIIPPELPQERIERVQQLAVDSFVASECEGMARVDFFVRDGGEVVVNELNTIPGFTPTSVYAKLFEASGIPYPELLDRLVDLAVERHERRSGLKY